MNENRRIPASQVNDFHVIIYVHGEQIELFCDLNSQNKNIVVLRFEIHIMLLARLCKVSIISEVIAKYI